MLSQRKPDTRLDALLDKRGRALRSLVEPEVTAALAALRGAGVVAEVIGSFAQGRFRSTSDVDFLVLDSGSLNERRVHDLLAQHLRSAPCDVVFAGHLPPGQADLMLAHARAATA